MGLFDSLKQHVPTAAVAVTATGRSELLRREPSAVIASGTGAESLALTVRQITGLDMDQFQQPSMVLRPQQAPAQADADPETRELVRQREHFLREVWQRWKVEGYKFDEAVLTAVVDNQEHWQLLINGGKNGNWKPVAAARNWFRKLGKRQNGEPRWDNIEALADHYARGWRETTIDPDFLQRFCRLYLSPGERDAYACWKIAKREFECDGMGDAVATFARCNYYARTRLSEQIKARARCPKDYKNLIRGFVKRHRNFGPGDVWFADHRTCDFWVKMPHPETGELIAVRPFVTGVMDAFTGKILAWVIYADQNPNWRRIAEAFALALHNSGNRPPVVWYIDNGKDFLKRGWAKAVRMLTRQGELLHRDGQPFDHSVLRELGSELRLARGYNGKEKVIERLFRDQAKDFDPFQPGYCGNSPATRPDYGDTWEGDINRLPTIGQVLQQLDEWVATHNAERTDGKPSADELWAAAVWTRPAFTDAQLTMALLLPYPVALKVDRSGYGLGGVSFAGAQYTHKALTEYGGKGLWGEYVMIKIAWQLPDIVHTDGKRHPPAVFVFTPEGRFVCIALAEVSVAEIAQTPEQKQLLGEVCHVIAAAANMHADELELHTGSRRVVHTNPALPAVASTNQQTVTLGATGLGSRRLPVRATTREKTVQTQPVDEDLLDTARSVLLPGEVTREVQPDTDMSYLLSDDSDISDPATAAAPADDLEDIKATLAQLEEY